MMLIHRTRNSFIHLRGAKGVGQSRRCNAPWPSARAIGVEGCSQLREPGVRLGPTGGERFVAFHPPDGEQMVANGRSAVDECLRERSKSRQGDQTGRFRAKMVIFVIGFWINACGIKREGGVSLDPETFEAPVNRFDTCLTDIVRRCRHYRHRIEKEKRGGALIHFEVPGVRVPHGLRTAFLDKLSRSEPKRCSALDAQWNADPRRRCSAWLTLTSHQ